MLLHPRFVVPTPGMSPCRYLRSLVSRGASLRWPSPLSPEIRARLDDELHWAEKQDACEYLLLVADVVKAAKDAGAVFGPGRGAATHSVVCYALGVTDVDPIRYRLQQKNFLSATSGFPDIDLELDVRGRLFARDYLIRKYGERNVAHLRWEGREFHPTALVLSSRPIDEVVSAATVTTCGAEYERRTVVQANVTAGQAVSAGLLRQDFVPAPWLTLIQRTLAEVRAGAGETRLRTGNAYADGLLTASTDMTSFFVDNVPLDDPAALKLFEAGDTAGIGFYSDPLVASFVCGERWTTFADMLSYYHYMRKSVLALKYRYSAGHHVAVALMAYRTAWVKAYFRKQFDRQYRRMAAEGWKFV